MASRRIENPVLFICDIQEKVRRAIYSFPSLLTTVQKLLRASFALQIPIYATTQNAAKLGSTVPELSLRDYPDLVTEVDKSAFSMCVPAILERLEKQQQEGDGKKATVIITGLETHICVTQTTLDLLDRGHRVYVVADGVSSCHAEERWVALERLRAAGAVITTSESVLFELVGDASSENFRMVSGLVKDYKEETREALAAFCAAKGGKGAGSFLGF